MDALVTWMLVRISVEPLSDKHVATHAYAALPDDLQKCLADRRPIGRSPLSPLVAFSGLGDT